MAYPSTKGTKLANKAKAPRPGIALKSEQILELIPKFRGNVSRIGDALGCTRHTVKNRIDQDPELKQALADARERWVDTLEDCVWVRAEESNDTALQMFLLKTQAKSRGYEATEPKDVAQDVAKAAFDYIINKSKNPATSS